MFDFWKHKVNGQVISNDCKNRLPLAHQSYYEPTSEIATHRVEEDDNDDGFVTSLIAASVIEDVIDSGTSFDTNDNDLSSDNNSDFGGFGGGDSGGGGASDSF